MKKLLVLLLAFILVSAPALAGVEDMDWMRWTNEMPFFETKHDLTLVSLHAVDQPTWDKKWFYRWAGNTMNINFDVIEIEENDRDEKLNLLFASDDLPDAFYNCRLTESEVLRYGLQEEQLIAMDDLIEQFAPDIKAFMAAKPDVAATWYNIDNKIYQLTSYIGYNSMESYTTLRAWINQRWLDNLQLENPATLDDFHAVLTAFKEQDANANGDPNDEIPMDDTLPNITQLMLNEMGAMTRKKTTLDPAIRNGQAMIPANDKEFYRAFLGLLNQYYTEGLLNQDMFTLTNAQLQADASEDLIGAHVQAAPHVLPTPDWADWSTIKPMTSEFNDKLQWPESDDITHGQYAITYKCQDPEAAIKFADWHFTFQGALYTWDGPIAGSEDLEPDMGGWYYDEETKSLQTYLPEGLTQRLEYIKLHTPATHTHVGISAQVEAAEYVLGHEVENKTSGAPRHWRSQMETWCCDYYSPCYPIMYFEEDVNDRIMELETPLRDYVTIMEAKFITGEEGMDKFDAYYEALQGMGLSEYESYYTDAYARYLSNLK